VYLSRFPWRALLLLWQLRIFAAAAARPDPTPPPFVGGGKYQKTKSPVASALAVGNVCVGVCVVGVVGVCVGMVAAFIFLEGVFC